VSIPFDAARYPQECPHVIDRTAMRMQWQDLTMLHWRYTAEEVQRLLPDGLTVETFDGSAWVGLVPFQMRVDIPFAPEMKRILHFPETNVRTYVHGKSGEPGVFFWSLEASSLPAVVAARASYQVPYFWSDMSVDRTTNDGRAINGRPTTGDIVRYEATRKWPKPSGATSLVEVEIGQQFAPGEVDEIDNFLTARWALYGSYSRWLSYAEMFHEPWPLHHATVREWDDELVGAAGLSQPTDDPIVHYSPEVNVRCGWPGKA
jgi:uncharacterized protein YqjF (DUF2071 family)